MGKRSMSYEHLFLLVAEFAKIQMDNAFQLPAGFPLSTFHLPPSAFRLPPSAFRFPL